MQVRFGGDDNGHIINELRQRYADAIDKEKEHSRFVENSWRKESDNHLFAELSVGVKSGTAEEIAAEINKWSDKLQGEMVPRDETSFYFKPVAISSGDNRVSIGVKVHWKNKLGKQRSELASLPYRYQQDAFIPWVTTEGSRAEKKRFIASMPRRAKRFGPIPTPPPF